MKLIKQKNHKDMFELPKELFFTGLNVTVDAVAIVNVNGTILWVNKSFEELTGYSAKEAIGKDTSLLKSGQQSEQFYQNMWNTLTSSQVWHGELWNKKKCGRYYLEDQTITPIENIDGDITHFIAIKRDISKKQLIKQQLEYADKMEAIGQIIGGFSHSFNNQVAKALGYTELATKILNTLTISQEHTKLLKHLRNINNASQESKKLIFQLQQYCRESAVQYEQLSLSQTVDEFIPLIRNTLPTQITLTYIGDKKNTLINADSMQLNQMLLILVQNAVSAQKNRVGKIQIEVKQISVNEQLCNSCCQSISGDYVSLSVKDDGNGIDEKHMKKLFLPFFTTHQIDGGTGMGLSVLHSLLHEHKGHVIVSSNENTHTIFNLLFPFKKSKDLKVDTQECNQVEEKNKTHILLVDDEQNVIDLLSEILEFVGYNVTAHTNVQSALSEYMSSPNKFDLLVTDNNMAGLTGLMLIRAIKNITPNLPSILISGKAVDEFNDDETFKSMVNGYLMKPFKTQQLSVMIEKLIAESLNNKSV